jgi:hypothetical protein
MADYDSKYLVIFAETLEVANAILRQSTLEMGLSEHNYQYLVGERDTGLIGGKTIKNHNVITWMGDRTVYEFDREIVAVMDAMISAKVDQMENVHWCTKDEVQAYLPQAVI